LKTLKRGQIGVDKKALSDHCKTIRSALNAMDKVMQKKESHERGRKIAKICNVINYSLDMIEVFQLKIKK